MTQLGIPFERRPSPPRRPSAMTVYEAVSAANRALEESFSSIWVEGEISNLRLAGSGHAYFTLKDERAALPCAMWRSSLQRLRFRLEEGQRLRVGGRMGIYPAQGKFQLYAEQAEPAGLGALMLQLEQLKQKLSAEGLFDEARKRSLPAWPKRIGVVTSGSGAAFHDILRVSRRRCPSRILLAPARVQGKEAPAELKCALERLQKIEDIDVIIIGRGGGAAEDLWAFNDEALVRAIAACSVPVVSAVGHEIDVTLSDLVADCRAATPSQAAEIVVPDRGVTRRELAASERRLHLVFERIVLDVRARWEDAGHRLEKRGRSILGELRGRWLQAERSLERQGRALAREPRLRLRALEKRLAAQHPRLRIERDRDRLRQAERALARVGARLGQEQRLRLAKAASKLDALSPLSVLQRGYAVVRDDVGRVLRDSGEAIVGQSLEIKLRSGGLRVEVRERIAEPKHRGAEEGGES